MKPMRNCWSADCSGVEAGVPLEAVMLGDDGGNKLARSRLARLRALTRRGRSLDDLIVGRFQPESERDERVTHEGINGRNVQAGRNDETVSGGA